MATTRQERREGVSWEAQRDLDVALLRGICAVRPGVLGNRTLSYSPLNPHKPLPPHSMLHTGAAP